MHQLQTKEYMDQMNANIGDKATMLEWINGERVLDAGCGGGVLTDILMKNHYDAYGIDLSLLSYKEMRDRGLGDRFIHGNLLDMSVYFKEEQFDTIIFSSVLHEVFSYNGFSYGDIEDTLENAMKIIPKGGHIIIRDGVKSPELAYRRIRFKDINDVVFLTEYCRRFKGRKVTYKQIDALTFEMKVDDAMEFLYTYTWGWDSFDREVQEQFGVFTLDKYESVARRVGGEIVHSEEYLQAGYGLYLHDKIEFFDENMKKTYLPNSTMLLVIQKK
jgi:SAM-dependent methyltransferase